MGGLFNLDGPFFKFGNIIADIMILSFIWILFSIPIFTIGASTTALFYVTTRRIADKEGYLIKDFVASFKSNFKMATKLWMLWLILGGLIALNIYWLRNVEFEPMLAAILLPVQIVVLVELYITALYLFPITARFEMTFRQTIKSAFYMANRHLLTTLSCVATTVAIIFAAAMFFEPILFVGMGVYAYITSYMFIQVFRKYRPEIDKEELAMEPLPKFDEAVTDTETE
ncbi:MAG: DUF624 domain-containing protein [Defluviitaleaceae bacterium]|nr:DUF624 domain-containing protein [Defluviitaleaceae bacterium]